MDFLTFCDKHIQFSAYVITIAAIAIVSIFGCLDCILNSIMKSKSEINQNDLDGVDKALDKIKDRLK